MYSRGLPGLGLVREDTPNPPEIKGPREFRGLVGRHWGHPCGVREAERRYWMWNSCRVDWVGNQIYLFI